MVWACEKERSARDYASSTRHVCEKTTRRPRSRCMGTIRGDMSADEMEKDDVQDGGKWIRAIQQAKH